MTWLSLSFALALGSSPAPEPVVETPPSSEPEQAEAQALYEDGLARYNTFDYEGAIEIWTRAYGKLPASEANQAARNAIVFNIARAQEKAFEQDHDIVHLVRAKSLLEVYVQENLDAGGTDEADLATARARIESFAERIRAAQAKPPPEPTKPASKPVDDGPRRRRGTGLVAGGATLLGLGVATVVGGVTAGVVTGNRASARIAGLDALGDEARRRDELARGRRSDTIAIATGVTGGVAAIAGVVMVAVGAKRMRKDGRSSSRRAHQVSPSFGRHHAGLTWSIGF